MGGPAHVAATPGSAVAAAAGLELPCSSSRTGSSKSLNAGLPQHIHAAFFVRRLAEGLAAGEGLLAAGGSSGCSKWSDVDAHCDGDEALRQVLEHISRAAREFLTEAPLMPMLVKWHRLRSLECDIGAHGATLLLRAAGEHGALSQADTLPWEQAVRVLIEALAIAAGEEETYSDMLDVGVGAGGSLAEVVPATTIGDAVARRPPLWCAVGPPRTPVSAKTGGSPTSGGSVVGSSPGSPLGGGETTPCGSSPNSAVCSSTPVRRLGSRSSAAGDGGEVGSPGAGASSPPRAVSPPSPASPLFSGSAAAEGGSAEGAQPPLWRVALAYFSALHACLTCMESRRSGRPPAALTARLPPHCRETVREIGQRLLVLTRSVGSASARTAAAASLGILLRRLMMQVEAADGFLEAHGGARFELEVALERCVAAIVEREDATDRAELERRRAPPAAPQSPGSGRGAAAPERAAARAPGLGRPSSEAKLAGGRALPTTGGSAAAPTGAAGGGSGGSPSGGGDGVARITGRGRVLTLGAFGGGGGGGGGSATAPPGGTGGGGGGGAARTRPGGAAAHVSMSAGILQSLRAQLRARSAPPPNEQQRQQPPVASAATAASPSYPPASPWRDTYGGQARCASPSSPLACRNRCLRAVSRGALPCGQRAGPSPGAPPPLLSSRGPVPAALPMRAAVAAAVAAAAGPEALLARATARWARDGGGGVSGGQALGQSQPQQAAPLRQTVPGAAAEVPGGSSPPGVSSGLPSPGSSSPGGAGAWTSPTKGTPVRRRSAGGPFAPPSRAAPPPPTSPSPQHPRSSSSRAGSPSPGGFGGAAADAADAAAGAASATIPEPSAAAAVRRPSAVATAATPLRHTSEEAAALPLPRTAAPRRAPSPRPAGAAAVRATATAPPTEAATLPATSADASSPAAVRRAAVEERLAAATGAVAEVKSLLCLKPQRRSLKSGSPEQVGDAMLELSLARMVTSIEASLDIASDCATKIGTPTRRRSNAGAVEKSPFHSPLSGPGAAASLEQARGRGRGGGAEGAAGPGPTRAQQGAQKARACGRGGGGSAAGPGPNAQAAQKVMPKFRGGVV